MEITTERVWEELHSELFRFINSRLKDTHTANDLLQDIFVKLHLKLSTLSEKEKLTSWVYTIARNTILDHFKKLKRKSNLPENIHEPELPEDYTAEFTGCLRPLINKLPDNYREAILNTELEGLSQKAYAEKAGISYSGAKSRVQRGRQQLSSSSRTAAKYLPTSMATLQTMISSIPAPIVKILLRPFLFRASIGCK